MKKWILICLIGIISTGLHSQEEKVKQRELGIGTASLNSFALVYKCGHQSAMWRFQSVLANGLSRKYENTELDTVFNESNSMRFGLAVGREWRSIISDHFEFRYGIDLAVQYEYSKNDGNLYKGGGNNSSRVYDRVTNEEYLLSPGIDLIIGVNYVFADHFVLGAELRPGFTYDTGERKEIIYFSDGTKEEQKYNISGTRFGLTNGSVLLTFSYRFIKS